MLVQYNLNVVCKGQGHHPLLLPRDAAFNVVESLPIQFLFWYSVLDFQKQSKIGTLSSFLHLKINRQTSKLIVTMLLKRHASSNNIYFTICEEKELNRKYAYYQHCLTMQTTQFASHFHEKKKWNK